MRWDSRISDCGWSELAESTDDQAPVVGALVEVGLSGVERAESIPVSGLADMEAAESIPVDALAEVLQRKARGNPAR